MDDLPSTNAFTWEIKNFSKRTRFREHIFSAVGYKWKIKDSIEACYLSIYLRVTDPGNLPCGWGICAKFSISLLNQINSSLTQIKEAQHKFHIDNDGWCFKEYISLRKFYDPKEGYLVKGRCKIKAVFDVPSLDNKRKREEQGIPTMHGISSRTSLIAPPPTNATKPSSTLMKKRSTIGGTILQGFMSEFVEDFPTCEKFGNVMDNLRSTMDGGNMGDIFEEWRPRILEIEALLGDIEDMEQQSEAPLRETLSKIHKSVIQFRQTADLAFNKTIDARFELNKKHKELNATLKKREELKGQISKLQSAVEKCSFEKLEAEKKIKELNQQKQVVTT